MLASTFLGAHRAYGCMRLVSIIIIITFDVVSSGKPLREWGAGLMEVLGKAKQYIRDQGRHVENNMEGW